MSIPSPERMATLALRCAGEVWKYGCVECGEPSELHEIQKRDMRKIMGAAACILGANLAPVCNYHHRMYEKLSPDEQMERMQGYMMNNYELRKAQRDQLIALKARWNQA